MNRDIRQGTQQRCDGLFLQKLDFFSTSCTKSRFYNSIGDVRMEVCYRMLDWDLKKIVKDYFKQLKKASGSRLVSYD